jgi:hypothetical protein
LTISTREALSGTLACCGNRVGLAIEKSSDLLQREWTVLALGFDTVKVEEDKLEGDPDGVDYCE